MSSGLSYEAVIDLLPAYVLGALEPDEMLAVEDYLEQQRTLLARVERLEAVTAQIAYAAPPAPLVPQLKATLMDKVRAEASPTLRSLPRRPAADRTAPATVGSPVLPSRQQVQRMALTQTERSRPQPPLPAPPVPRYATWGWLAAAAMAAAAILIIWIDIGAQRQLSQLQVELVNRNTQLAQLTQQVQVLEDQLQQDRAQLAFFANPSQIVSLSGTEKAPNAGGVFYQHNERALVLLHGLPPLPADQTYQLWLIPSDGAPVPAGLLAVQSVAVNQQSVTLPADALAYSTIGISIEPATGSLAPTGDIVMTGTKT